MHQTPPLIKVAGLQLHIEGQQLLDDLHFEIGPNERIAIVGESGSGKSLTALSLLGLQPKKAKLEANVMSFKGQPLNSLSEAAWRNIRTRQIGMIFQEPQSSLNPSMRCGKQLQEVLQTHSSLTPKQQKEQIEAALEEVQLHPKEHILKAYPHALSGGQKQRLMIAMALLCKPDLLLADEPTTALDVTVQKEILDLLLALQQKHGMSIVFISHDLALVKKFAQRVMVMRKGKIVETNTAKLLFENPQHPYTKGLLFARPKMEQRYRKLPTLQDYEKDTFNPLVISPNERRKKHELLYQKKPLLTVSGLEKTHANDSLFGWGQKKNTYSKKLFFFTLSRRNPRVSGGFGIGKIDFRQSPNVFRPCRKREHSF